MIFLDLYRNMRNINNSDSFCNQFNRSNSSAQSNICGCCNRNTSAGINRGSSRGFNCGSANTLANSALVNCAGIDFDAIQGKVVCVYTRGNSCPLKGVFIKNCPTFIELTCNRERGICEPVVRTVICKEEITSIRFCTY